MEPVDAIDSSVHGSKAYGLMLNHCDPNNYNSAYEILDAITSNLSPSPMEVIIGSYAHYLLKDWFSFAPIYHLKRTRGI